MAISNKQSGAVLIFLVFLMTLIISGYAINALSTAQYRAERDRKTNQALAEAKSALIGWSLAQDTKPGTLPCTDTLNTGSAVTAGANACNGYLARLPWKELGLQDLRDGDGECLWYALSPTFRNAMNNATRVSQPLVTANGSISIQYPTAPALNNVVAVVFSPGIALPGQDRSSALSTVCGGNVAIQNYLESYDAINLIFNTGINSQNFNDKLIYITKQDIYIPLRKRMAAEMMGNIAIHSGPLKFFDTNAKYPCASDTLAGAQKCGNPALTFLPFADLAYPQLGTWMQSNGWLSIASYSFDDTKPGVSKLTLTINGVSSCTANGSAVLCTH